MSENWNEIGRKLYDAADKQRIDAVKKIVTKSQRNSRVLDWKNEEVDCKLIEYHDIYFCSHIVIL